MRHFIAILALVLVVSCGDNTHSSWSLVERPSDPEAAGRVSDGVAPEIAYAAACEGSRAFIAGLELVDEATLQRRPADEVVEIHEDVGADGSVERCWIRLFDEKGRLVVSTQDTHAPAGPDSIHQVLEYDDRFDEPTVYRSDTDGDGALNTKGEVSMTPVDCWFRRVATRGSMARSRPARAMSTTLGGFAPCKSAS